MKQMRSIKCVVCGGGDSKKTALLISMTTNGSFNLNDYIPTVFDSYSTNIMVDKLPYQINLWDTAGQQEYDRLRPLSYPSTDVFLLVFNLTNRRSLESIENKFCPEIMHFCPGIPFLVIGTSLEERKDGSLGHVSFQEGFNFALSINAYKYMECSYVTCENVQQIFAEIVGAVKNSPLQNRSQTSKKPGLASRLYNFIVPQSRTKEQKMPMQGRKQTEEPILATDEPLDVSKTSEKLELEPENNSDASKEQFEKQIQELLDIGSIVWNRSKIMMVGQGRVGKSCLAMSLIGNDFIEDNESTKGIESDFSCVLTQVGLNDSVMSVVEPIYDELPMALAKLNEIIKDEASHQQEIHDHIHRDDVGIKSDSSSSNQTNNDVVIVSKPPNIQLEQIHTSTPVISYETSYQPVVAISKLTINSRHGGIASPIAFVGTRKDTVSDPHIHLEISNLILKLFKDNPIWQTILINRDETNSLFFFPVNNRLSNKDPTIQRFPSDWNTLIERGVISRFLLVTMLQSVCAHVEIVIELMVKFSMLVPVEQDHNNSNLSSSAELLYDHYIVPSLLPSSTNNNNITPSHNNENNNNRIVQQMIKFLGCRLFDNKYDICKERKVCEEVLGVLSKHVIDFENSDNKANQQETNNHNNSSDLKSWLCLGQIDSHLSSLIMVGFESVNDMKLLKYDYIQRVHQSSGAQEQADAIQVLISLLSDSYGYAEISNWPRIHVRRLINLMENNIE
eukprot:gene10732-14416_t